MKEKIFFFIWIIALVSSCSSLRINYELPMETVTINDKKLNFDSNSFNYKGVKITVKATKWGVGYHFELKNETKDDVIIRWAEFKNINLATIDYDSLSYSPFYINFRDPVRCFFGYLRCN